MAKFRKKPVIIEAVQFTGADWARFGGVRADVPEFFDRLEAAGARFSVDGKGPYLTIPTLEGDHRADKGDWIIQGVKGEFYPCKPEIFAMTYEPAA